MCWELHECSDGARLPRACPQLVGVDWLVRLRRWQGGPSRLGSRNELMTVPPTATHQRAASTRPHYVPSDGIVPGDRRPHARRRPILSSDRWLSYACSGLVDLVVCVRHYFGGGHHFALAGERFVGLVAEDIAEVGDRRVDLRERSAARGLSAKPPMVAAGSWRPSRSKRAARTASGLRIMAVLPESW